MKERFDHREQQQRPPRLRDGVTAADADRYELSLREQFNKWAHWLTLLGKTMRIATVNSNTLTEAEIKRLQELRSTIEQNVALARETHYQLNARYFEFYDPEHSGSTGTSLSGIEREIDALTLEA